MKIKIICLVFLLLISCNKQKGENDHNAIIVKKLDNNYLKKINETNKKIQFSENDSIIELKLEGDVIIEKRRRKNDSLFNFFSYDKKDNLLIASGTIFYDIPVGIFKRYNKSGEVIEEINRDENFPFSINQLKNKLKVRQQSDTTFIVTNITRNFYKKDNRYIYMINYKNDQSTKSKLMCIDGKTGKTVSDVMVKIII